MPKVPRKGKALREAHRRKGAAVSGNRPEPPATARRAAYTYLAELPRWASRHTFAAFVGSIGFGGVGSWLVLNLMSSLQKPVSGFDHLIWIGGTAVAIGGTLIVIVLWGFTGLFGALILYDSLFPLPLLRWPYARGCCGLIGAVIGGWLAGLYGISLLATWLTSG